MDNIQTQNAPSSTPYADRLKTIEEQVAGVRTQAATLAQQQGKTDLASQIRSSGRTLSSNAPLVVNDEVANPIIDVGQFAGADNGLKAITSIAAKTNSIKTDYNRASLSEEFGEKPEPLNLNIPGYFSDGTGADWQSIAKQLKQAAENPFSREQKLQQTYKDWGITESFDLLKGITGQALSIKSEIDKINQQEEAELKRVQNTPGGTISSGNAERTRISYEYGSKKAPLAATLAGYAAQAEMIRGNISLAKTYADELVHAATYDAESKVKMLKDTGDYYKDILDNMGEQYKLVFNTAKENAQRDYDQQKTERKQIVSWATNLETAPALYSKNLAALSFDEAAGLVSDYLSMHAIKNGEDLLSVDEAKKLRVPYGTTKGQAAALGIIPRADESTGDSGFWTAIKAGVNELQSGENWGQVWNRIKMQFPNVADSEIDNALGTSWKEPAAYEQFKAKTKSNTFIVGNPNFGWDLSE